MFDKGLRHVTEQHLAVLGGTVKFPAGIAMTHRISPWILILNTDNR
jgi:hypothetical protein